MTQYKVEPGYTLWVTSQYNGGSNIGVLKGGDVVEEILIQSNWIKFNFGSGTGWSKLTDGTSTFISIVDTSEILSLINKTNSTQTTITVGEVYGPAYVADADTVISSSNASTTSVPTYLKNLRGIHGIPYQYMESADRRISSDSVFGRKYCEKIITNMPLLLLTPGRPKFMNAFTVNEASDVLKYMAQKDDNYVDELVKGKGRYYSFEFDYVNYYYILNPMCQIMARLLNIQDKTLDGKRLDTYEWQNYTNSSFKNLFSAEENIAFFLDSESQISESFSNGTGESMLASQVNSLSDTAREVQFLLGSTSGIEMGKLAADNHTATLEEFNSFFGKYLNKVSPGQLAERLTSGILTVATGGKLIFPEIWNESSFSRSYNINMKFRTPDSDNFSWFMNIGVPLLHLLAIVAPQEMDANSYSSPFLVRAYYKGFFNTDMGIITGMNISKGSQAKWTADGLPTEVDVSIDLKDLYNIMMVTQEAHSGLLNGPLKMLNNTCLIDYVSNMCGININKPAVQRTIDLYRAQIENNFVNTITFNSFAGVKQALDNLVNGVLRK